MSLIFKCLYCHTTPPNFKALVRHYESEHNPGSEQYRKLRERVSYSGSDSGCEAATEYLGYPSSCLQCPFKKCIYDERRVASILTIRKRQRDEQILKGLSEGKEVLEMASIFGVSKRTIQRVRDKHKKRAGG